MVSPVQYFQEVTRELKKVSWPSRDQTLQKTLLVLIVSAALGLYLGGLDFLFQKAVNLLLNI